MSVVWVKNYDAYSLEDIVITAYAGALWQDIDLCL